MPMIEITTRPPDTPSSSSSRNSRSSSLVVFMTFLHLKPAMIAQAAATLAQRSLPATVNWFTTRHPNPTFRDGHHNAGGGDADGGQRLGGVPVGCCNRAGAVALLTEEEEMQNGSAIVRATTVMRP